MRLVDYFSTVDDGDDHFEAAGADRRSFHGRGKRGRSMTAGCKTYHLQSPTWRSVSRLFSSAFKCGGGRPRLARRLEHEDQEGDEGVSRNGDRGADPAGTPGSGCEGAGIRDATSENLSGCQRQDLSFNLLAGISLLSFVVFARVELNKILELRRQIESYHENLKAECQSKDRTPQPSESGVTCLTEDAQHGADHCDHFSFSVLSPQLSVAPSEATLICDQFSLPDTVVKEVCIGGKNRFEDLEVELETELERLQFHLQEKEPSEHNSQMNNADASASSSSISFIEMIDPQQAVNDGQCGVDPLELERRLHELLEARQEERIRELESDLKLTKQKLDEKEMEANWWRDTAKLISKHAPESSQIMR